MGTFEGKLAVVTGASSGIGEATAARLACLGAKVVLVARRKEPLEQIAARIKSAGGQAVVEALDAADGAAVLEMAARVQREHGTPDFIVNSAGAGVWRFVEETPPDMALQMLGAPYLAAYNVTHAFMQAMLDRGRGVILHVGSPFSVVAWPGATAYGAARWALRGLHEALCQDLRGTGVSSCHVVFGKVSSAYFENNPESEAHIPGLGRLVPEITPAKCAEVITDLLERPQRDYQYPFLLRTLFWAYAVAPGPVRWLAARTGRRH